LGIKYIPVANEIITLASGTLRRRQATGAKNLVPKFARTDQREYSFSVKTEDRWNRLPGEIKPGRRQKET
jgi:hypothetical protein